MLDKNTTVIATNRFDGYTGYSIPDLGIQRNFNPGEKKEITMEELRKLSYQPGGMVIISDYLILDNQDAINELLGEVEPEYYYTEKEIRDIMEKGTLPEFLDMLDFSPAAVLEIIKTMAVKIELNDVKKREAIFEKTGFNVNKAIENVKAEKEAENEVEEAPKTARRVAKPTTPAPTTETTTGRRVAKPVSK